jgi:cytochrome c553
VEAGGNFFFAFFLYIFFKHEIFSTFFLSILAYCRCALGFEGKRTAVVYTCVKCHQPLHRRCIPREISRPHQSKSKFPPELVVCAMCHEEEGGEEEEEHEEEEEGDE